jgi:SsrA-binding protein
MIIATNKRAKFDYTILETYQAGLCLSGAMVKLVRANQVNIAGKFIVYQKDRLEILGMGNEKLIENIPLLMSKKEINKISGQIAEKGISCVILNLKIVGRWLKADIATVKGKKEYDKRETIKKRDIDRDERRGDL